MNYKNKLPGRYSNLTSRKIEYVKTDAAGMSRKVTLITNGENFQSENCTKV